LVHTTSKHIITYYNPPDYNGGLEMISFGVALCRLKFIARFLETKQQRRWLHVLLPHSSWAAAIQSSHRSATQSTSFWKYWCMIDNNFTWIRSSRFSFRTYYVSGR